ARPDGPRGKLQAAALVPGIMRRGQDLWKAPRAHRQAVERNRCIAFALAGVGEAAGRATDSAASRPHSPLTLSGSRWAVRLQQPLVGGNILDVPISRSGSATGPGCSHGSKGGGTRFVSGKQSEGTRARPVVSAKQSKTIR